MKVRLERIEKAFGRNRVLQGISLDVCEGGFFVLIGPTGCGKTTVLKLVDLLLKPDGGLLEIDGIDMGRASGHARSSCRRRMAMVMQRPYMFAGTVERNVGMGLAFRRPEADARAVSEALESVGLAGFEKREARTLSGGEIQKAAIARAIVTKPEILLLDEPMSSVDPGFRPEIRSLLRRLHHDTGMTVIMATHDFADALALGTGGAVILEGRAAQQGTMDDLFQRPSSPEVARFVGMRNILHAEFSGQNAMCGALELRLSEPSSLASGYLVIPPEAVTVALSKPESSQRNVFPARVIRVEKAGWTCAVELDLGGPVLSAQLTSESVEEMGIRPGLDLYAAFKATAVRVLE